MTYAVANLSCMAAVLAQLREYITSPQDRTSGIASSKTCSRMTYIKTCRWGMEPGKRG